MRRKRIIIPILAIFLLYSCTKKKGQEESGRLKKFTFETGGTLVIGIQSDPDDLNPLTALSQTARDIISLIFERLADINSDLLTFSPRLARSWEFSHDSLSIVFHLRTDVYWHDGAKFTSQDVVFTHSLQTNPETGWDGITFKDHIIEVTAPDDSTVIYRFDQRYPYMLMDAVEGYIVPEHILKDIPPARIHSSNFGRSPVGTGPFIFKDWVFQQNITLERNPNYHDKGKPYLNKVIFKILPDELTIFNELINREIDLAYRISPHYFIKVEKLWEKKKTHAHPYRLPGRAYDFIGWNLFEPRSYFEIIGSEEGEKDTSAIRKLVPHRLFSSQKVRAALTMAINRDELRQVVLEGLAIPLDGPIPPILWAYNDTILYRWDYNPSLAKKFLREEGWRDEDGDGILEKDSIEFCFEMYTNAGNSRRERAIVIVQDQLKKIGVKVIPKIVEPAFLFGYILPERQYDAALIGWNVGLKVYLTPLFHSKTFFLPFHFTGYLSPKYDRLEDMALSAKTFEQAKKYWNEIAKMLSYELPYTWLYYEYFCVAVDNRFKGTVFDVRGPFVNVESWWIPAEEKLQRDRL